MLEFRQERSFPLFRKKHATSAAALGHPFVIEIVANRRPPLHHFYPCQTETAADILIFITDAGDDELAALRPILKGHGKPVAVTVVCVAGGQISAPQAFR